jgi:hypothetical protein
MFFLIGVLLVMVAALVGFVIVAIVIQGEKAERRALSRWEQIQAEGELHRVTWEAMHQMLDEARRQDRP